MIHPVEYGLDKNLHLRASTLRHVLVLFSTVVHLLAFCGVTRIFVKLSQRENVSHGKFYRLPQYFKALLNLFRALAEVQLISDLVYNSTLSSTLHYREYHRLLLQVCLLCKVFGFGKFLGLGSSWVWACLGSYRAGRAKMRISRALLYYFPNTSQTQELPKPKNFT